MWCRRFGARVTEQPLMLGWQRGIFRVRQYWQAGNARRAVTQQENNTLVTTRFEFSIPILLDGLPSRGAEQIDYHYCQLALALNNFSVGNQER